ncbi:hypothetical protein [Vaginisenegalia massiliensis]|nr:hypothetical protein [Vaginisenegalia massiliensis]
MRKQVETRRFSPITRVTWQILLLIQDISASLSTDKLAFLF